MDKPYYGISYYDKELPQFGPKEDREQEKKRIYERNYAELESLSLEDEDNWNYIKLSLYFANRWKAKYGVRYRMLFYSNLEPRNSVSRNFMEIAEYMTPPSIKLLSFSKKKEAQQIFIMPRMKRYIDWMFECQERSERLEAYPSFVPKKIEKFLDVDRLTHPLWVKAFPSLTY